MFELMKHHKIRHVLVANVTLAWLADALTQEQILQLQNELLGLPTRDRHIGVLITSKRLADHLVVLLLVQIRQLHSNASLSPCTDQTMSANDFGAAS